MKVLIGVCFLFLISRSSSYTVGEYHEHLDNLDESRFMFIRNNEGQIEMVDLLSEEVTITATEEDVTYRLFTQANVKEEEIITKENITESKYYDSKRKTIFLAHGWRNDRTSSFNVVVKGTLLELYDFNVIVVDWSGPANRNYISAQGAVTVIGKALGDFINNMLDKNLTTLSQIIIIGHSLGSHVAGNAGAAVNGQVDTILGLDPARPLFTYENIENRLDPTDAEYVYVIHTSGGLLGFQKPIGHCDFFPNSGAHQPGCGFDLDGTCGHSRAYEYYEESLKSDKFVSYECTSYDDYRNGKCKDNKKVSMGGYPFDKTLNGSFFLDTNSKAPYAKG